jgi:hypothetical protein
MVHGQGDPANRVPNSREAVRGPELDWDPHLEKTAVSDLPDAVIVVVHPSILGPIVDVTDAGINRQRVADVGVIHVGDDDSTPDPETDLVPPHTPIRIEGALIEPTIPVRTEMCFSGGDHGGKYPAIIPRVDDNLRDRVVDERIERAAAPEGPRLTAVNRLKDTAARTIIACVVGFAGPCVNDILVIGVHGQGADVIQAN